MAQDPFVLEVMQTFPGAEIVSIRTMPQPEAAPAPDEDADSDED